jgi:hypothetical protein
MMNAANAPASAGCEPRRHWRDSMFGNQTRSEPNRETMARGPAGGILIRCEDRPEEVRELHIAVKNCLKAINLAAEARSKEPVDLPNPLPRRAMN